MTLAVLAGCAAQPETRPTTPPLRLAAGVELHVRADLEGAEPTWVFVAAGPRAAPKLAPDRGHRLSFAAGQVDVPALVAELAAHPQVEALHVWDATALTRADYEALGRLRGLRALTLLGAAGLDGVGLAGLALAPHLERLQIDGAPCDAADLANLALAPRLRELTLSGCAQLRDAGWLDAPWGGLERLALDWNPGLDAACLAGLPDSPAAATLSALSLRGATASDWSWLGALARSPTLTALDLSGCALDEPAFAGLGRLVALTRLDLRAVPGAASPVGDAAWLAHLAQLPALRQLDLGFHALDAAAAIAALAALPRLEALDLAGWELDAAAHARLRAVSTLRTLCCNLWGASPEVEQPLLTLPQVTAFRPYGGIEPFTESVANLSGWVALEQLDLRSSDETGDGSLQALEGVPQLRRLLLDAAQVTDLRPLLSCPRLEVLSLRRCAQLTPEAVGVLARLTHLEVLDLRGCPWVDDAALARLERLDGLRVVLLHGTQVSAAGLDAFRCARPACLVGGAG